MRLKILASAIIIAIIVTACSDQTQNANTGDTLLQQGALSGTPEEMCNSVEVVDTPQTSYSQAENVLVNDIDYHAIFCTDAGAIYVDLFEEFTPVTVNNFVFLSERGFYNNTTFHRVLEDFMAQGGDPTGTGTGTPGYRFEDEFVGFLHFDKPGLLAMANSGQPGTNGSQFFITTSTPTYLNYRHTIFGEVIEGQEVVESLRLRDPQQSPDFEGSRLITVIVISDPEAVNANVTRTETLSREDISRIVDSIDAIPGLETFSQESAEIIVDDRFSELNQYEYQFSVEITHRSNDCDTTQIPLFDTGMQLLVFPSADNAQQAIESEGFGEKAIRDPSLDYEIVESSTLPYPIQIADTEACGLSAVHAVAYWQHGRYVMIVDTTIVESESGQADLWLEQVVGWRIYEYLLSDILRAEIGQ